MSNIRSRLILIHPTQLIRLVNLVNIRVLIRFSLWDCNHYLLKPPRLQLVVEVIITKMIFQASSWLNMDGMPGMVSFTLYDTAGTALTSPDLPSDPYPLIDFSSTGFGCTILGPPSFNHPSGTDLIVYGTVDSFYAIPEPGSLTLLAMAALVLRTRRGR